MWKLEGKQASVWKSKEIQRGKKYISRVDPAADKHDVEQLGCPPRVRAPSLGRFG
jgi:hypothetical protein